MATRTTVRAQRVWRSAVQKCLSADFSKEDRQLGSVDGEHSREKAKDFLPNRWLYTSVCDDDGLVSATAKPLNDTVKIDDYGSPIYDKNGEPIIISGVKSRLIAEVHRQQMNLLFFTDWAVSRDVHKQTVVPDNILAWRRAIRAQATDMETAIFNAPDTRALAKLFVTLNADRIEGGVLFAWPEFE